MSIATVKAQLATLQKQIAGINAAYAQAPWSEAWGNLPSFVNFAGPATCRPMGSDTSSYWIEAREYRMDLLVETVQAGIPGEAEAKVEPFISAVRDFFLARPKLDNLAHVYRSVYVSDSGIRTFEFPRIDDVFLGVEFRLSVEELLEVRYAEYD